MATEELSDKAIFNFARSLESAEAIATYLDQVCGENPTRKARIQELLLGDKSDSFLEKPPVGLPETVEGRTGVSIGQRIGRYKLLQRLGEGGFGVVYMAEQTEPVNRQVALKVIKPGMDTKDVIARFEAERQALAMMDHPNIAQVFDGGETEDGHPYFVMELVRGIPLTKFCDENKFDTRERLKLLKLVCQALQHAHQKGIIHRDIKPSNVMVTLHDGVPVPKVIDFGVSKAIAQKLTAKTLFTSYGQMVGTPLYMSPEQAEMSGLDVDTRSDVYSLGVLLYELLTGTTPLNPEVLQQTAYAELQRMIREDEPPRPSRRLSTLGAQSVHIAQSRRCDPKRLTLILRGELDWIVMKCLEKNRDRRYDAAKSIADDIDRYLKGEAVLACPPSTAYLLKKVCLKYRVPVLIATSFFVLLLAGLAGTISGWVAEKRASTRAIDAFEREQTAKQDLEATNRSQTLVIAYEAYGVGNIQRARELLASFVPETGTPWYLPWRFLNERCKEVAPTRVDFGSPTICRVGDPLGRFRAVAIEPGDLVLDSQPNEPLIRLESRLRPVDLAMTDDGRFLFIGCDNSDGDGLIQRWEIKQTASGFVASELPDYPIAGARLKGMVYSNRHDKFFVLMADGTCTAVDANSGRVEASVPTGQKDRARIRLSPSEAFIVMDDWSGEIELLDAVTLQSRMDTIKYPARIHAVAISPDESRLIICGVEGTEIWDLDQQSATRRGHLDYQRSMTCGFSADGTRLGILNHDQKIISVRSVSSGLEIFRIPLQDGTPRRPRCHELTFDGSQIVVRCKESLNTYDLPDQQGESRASDSFWHAPIAVSPVDPEIAFPARNGLLTLWNPETNGVRTVQASGGRENRSKVLAVAYSSNGQQLIVSRSEQGDDESDERLRFIEIIDRTSGAIVNTITDNEENVWLAEFLPSNNDFLLTSARSNDIRIYDLTKHPATYQRIRSPRGRGVVVSAPFSPSGSLVALGGNIWRDEGEQELVPGELWDLSDPAHPRLDRKIDSENTYSLRFSRDGKELACIESRAPQVALIDLKDNSKRIVPVSCSAIISVEYSPDDQCLVIVVPSGEIKFVDRRSGEELGTFRVNHPLRHIRFMEKFDRLVASTMDDLVMQWKY